MKVVKNSRADGFRLSEKAYKYLGLEWDGYGFANHKYEGRYLRDEDGNCLYDIPLDYSIRTDIELVNCVLTLGEKASGKYSLLRVIEIPDYIQLWTITHQNGHEAIIEYTGRVWQ